MPSNPAPAEGDAPALGSHLAAHPLRYRIAIALLLFAIGRCFVHDPLASRIEAATASRSAARETAALAAEARAWREQREVYRARLLPRHSGPAFEREVIARLRDSGVAVRTLASRPAIPLGPYAVAVVAVEAEGTYGRIVDFVDRIERGEPIARLEHVRIVRDGDLLRFHALLLCLMHGDG